MWKKKGDKRKGKKRRGRESRRKRGLIRERRDRLDSQIGRFTKGSHINGLMKKNLHSSQKKNVYRAASFGKN